MGGPSVKTSGMETLETIGMDQNTHLDTIGNLNKVVEMVVEPVVPVPPLVLPDTKKAYEALASIEKLQEQLLYVSQHHVVVSVVVCLVTT